MMLRLLPQRPYERLLKTGGNDLSPQENDSTTWCPVAPDGTILIHYFRSCRLNRMSDLGQQPGKMASSADSLWTCTAFWRAKLSYGAVMHTHTLQGTQTQLQEQQDDTN